MPATGGGALRLVPIGGTRGLTGCMGLGTGGIMGLAGAVGAGGIMGFAGAAGAVGLGAGVGAGVAGIEAGGGSV